MSKTLNDFFSDNDVRIGKDFQTIPPIYYQSLTEGMHGYFNTILTLKFKYNLLVNTEIHNRESIAFNFNDSNSTVSCLLGLHRFFELLLKDLLSRVNPFLAVKFLENENQQIAYLNQTLDYEKVNTIEFSDAYKRFKALIKSTKNEVKNLDISKIEPFKFLVEDDTLKQLSTWRNRIIHNGKTLPNLFALDYIITQKVLPLIAKVLETDKQPQTEYFPPYFITPSGINILELLLKIKFDFRDFYKKDDKNNRMLISKLFLIGHLKELARASFYFDRHITEDNISYQESYYENPIARFHRFAKAEEGNEFYFNTEMCLSCGVKTLIIYKKVNTDLLGKKLDYYYCRCTSCDYFFSENFADPFALGLSKQRIFPLH
jgi:hypothetical protein